MAYLSEFGIHIVHFDDGRDRYLQFRTREVSEDPREVEPGGEGLGDATPESYTVLLDTKTATSDGRGASSIAKSQDEWTVPAS